MLDLKEGSHREEPKGDRLDHPFRSLKSRAPVFDAVDQKEDQEGEGEYKDPENEHEASAWIVLELEEASERDEHAGNDTEDGGGQFHRKGFLNELGKI